MAYQCGNINLLVRVQRQAAHWSCGSRWNPIALSWSQSSEVCLKELLYGQLYYAMLTLSFYLDPV